jgi:hypothetical protein
MASTSLVSSVEVDMPIAPLRAARTAKRTLRRLQPLVPVALFMAVLASFGALAAAAHTRSPALIAVAAVAMVGSIAGMAAWVVLSDRRARQPVRHVPWRDYEWSEFERLFWDYVQRRSSSRRDRDDA